MEWSSQCLKKKNKKNKKNKNLWFLLLSPCQLLRPSQSLKKLSKELLPLKWKNKVDNLCLNKLKKERLEKKNIETMSQSLWFSPVLMKVLASLKSKKLLMLLLSWQVLLPSLNRMRLPNQHLSMKKLKILKEAPKHHQIMFVKAMMKILRILLRIFSKSPLERLRFRLRDSQRRLRNLLKFKWSSSWTI